MSYATNKEVVLECPTALKIMSEMRVTLYKLSISRQLSVFQTIGLSFLMTSTVICEKGTVSKGGFILKLVMNL